jgi:hypothetical protein
VGSAQRQHSAQPPGWIIQQVQVFYKASSWVLFFFKVMQLAGYIN